jgi:hypothetical protein
LTATVNGASRARTGLEDGACAEACAANKAESTRAKAQTMHKPRKKRVEIRLMNGFAGAKTGLF